MPPHLAPNPPRTEVEIERTDRRETVAEAVRRKAAADRVRATAGPRVAANAAAPHIEANDMYRVVTSSPSPTITPGSRANGARASWFASEPWEDLLAQPLEDVRARLGVPVPDLYRQIREAGGEAFARPGTPQPVAA